MATKVEIYLTIEDRTEYGVRRLVIQPMRREAGYVLNCNYGSVWDDPRINALADLELTSYFSDDGKLYGLEAEYRSVFSVNAHRAAIMAKTLARVQKAIDNERSGDSGDRFMAFAKSIGAVGFVENRTPDCLNLREATWRFHALVAGRAELRRIVEPKKE